MYAGMPAAVAARKARAAAEEAEAARRAAVGDDEDEVDPLDAFMSAEVGWGIWCSCGRGATPPVHVSCCGVYVQSAGLLHVMWYHPFMG
jgi:hypothetical protein